MSEAERARSAAAAAVQRWSLPVVEGPIVGVRRDPAEAERARERERAAREAERARGYEDGLAAGRAAVEARIAQLDERIAHLDSILGLLARPLEELDAEVERQLARLALAVGCQLARRELKADPAQVIAVIREAVDRLPAAARGVEVRLHPEDAAVVRERLAMPAAERAWTLVEDPTLSRGGCLVRSDASLVDARFESRVDAVVASVLGEERAAPRTGAADAPGSEP